MGCLKYLDRHSNPTIRNLKVSFRKSADFIEGEQKSVLNTNHLGNVATVVTDQKIVEDIPGVGLRYVADVTSATEYYPFGMSMPDRMHQTPSYRYGFNGMERDEEFNGTNNTYDFGARIYDSRIGKMISLDPMKEMLPSVSPYLYAMNRPLSTLDVDGEFPILINGNTSGGDHERASANYWDETIIKAIQAVYPEYAIGETVNGSKETASIWSEDYLFVDGNRGAPDFRTVCRNSINCRTIDKTDFDPILASTRQKAGTYQAKQDLNAIWNKLTQSVDEQGKITEKIQIITHSRGGHLVKLTLKS